ncbi:PKD domain-containing protein [Flavitalea antarctica]
MKTSIQLFAIVFAILSTTACKKDTGGPIAARLTGAQPRETDKLPTANAGPDVYVVPPAASCKLYGSATIHKNGVERCMWLKISGPAVYKIDEPESFKPTVSDLIRGLYQFELTIIDGKGFTDVDTVTVTVGELPTPKQSFKNVYWNSEGPNGTLMWGAVLTIKNIYSFLPVGSNISVMISAGIPGTWTEALKEGAPGSENALYSFAIDSSNLYVWSNAEETGAADMMIYY